MSIVTDDMIKHAYEGWKNGAKKTDSIMFLHQRLFHEKGILCAMNNTEMKTQMRDWRRLAKQGKLTIRFINSKSRTLEDGNTWHWFVVQPINDDSNLDSLGLFLLGEWVDGFIYCFKSKENKLK